MADKSSENLAKEIGLLSRDITIESSLLVASSLVKNPKIKNGLIFASVAYGAGRKLYSKFSEHREERRYTIKINESDMLYDTLQRWFLEALPVTEQRTLVAKSRFEMDHGLVPEGFRPNGRYSSDTTARIDVFYDGSRRQQINIDGHVVSIVVQAENGRGGPGEDESRIANKYKFKHLTIECKTVAARDAVLERLKIEAQKNIEKRTPRFNAVDKWGDFVSLRGVPARKLDSVVLKPGQVESIVADLEKFLSQEQRYVDLGIPYHRGILLYGPPGTGKTSVASAIASHLGLDIYYIALSSVKDDATLNDLLGSVKEQRCVLLLEDVDVAHATKERSDENPGVTMSGLLNALDGFMTPHGLITVMTTNHLEVLDPALIRPGRIDLLEEVSYVDTEQVKRLCKQFIGVVPGGLPEVTETDQITPSEIVEVFKKNLSEPAETTAQAVLDELHLRLGARKEASA